MNNLIESYTVDRSLQIFTKILNQLKLRSISYSRNYRYLNDIDVVYIILDYNERIKKERKGDEIKEEKMTNKIVNRNN